MVDSSPNHISAIETGKVTNPGIEIAHRLAAALHFQLSIGDQVSIVKEANPLAYEAPFSFGKEESAEESVRDALQSVSEALFDRRLTSVDRKRISEMIASLAQWLRDRSLTDR